MELTLLRAFLAVVEHGTYGRAAGALVTTQPTLTKQIQSLEARVGGRLLDRGRHGATPTSLGSILLPEARDLLQRADALAEHMARAVAGDIGRLSIGFGLSSVDIAPRAVAAFRTRHPEVQVTLEDMSSREQLRALVTGALSVGFVRLPAEGTWGRMVVGEDRLALASSNVGEPLPKDAAGVSRWVADHELVRLARTKGPGLAGQIDALCAVLGVQPRMIQEAHDIQTVLALVAAGVGTALVPASARRIAPPSVTVTDIDLPVSGWQVAAVWARDRLEPATANFLAVLKESHAPGRAAQ